MLAREASHEVRSESRARAGVGGWGQQQQPPPPPGGGGGGGNFPGSLRPPAVPGCLPRMSQHELLFILLYACCNDMEHGSRQSWFRARNLRDSLGLTDKEAPLPNDQVICRVPLACVVDSGLVASHEWAGPTHGVDNHEPSWRAEAFNSG